MVWLPEASVAVKLPPFPIRPLTLEDQTSFVVRSPSSTSEPVPLNETDEELTIAPLLGLRIDTTGGVLGLGPTVTMTVAAVMLPSESLARAVMLRVPLLRVFWKLPPVPI